MGKIVNKEQSTEEMSRLLKYLHKRKLTGLDKIYLLKLTESFLQSEITSEILKGD